METRPDQMENFQNVSKIWRDPVWEPGRKYSVPWTWGSTGISVNTAMYSGDINTAELVSGTPPEELVGKINVLPVMNDVLSMAILYVGGELWHRRQRRTERSQGSSGFGQTQMEIHQLRHQRKNCQRRRSCNNELEWIQPESTK